MSSPETWPQKWIGPVLHIHTYIIIYTTSLISRGVVFLLGENKFWPFLASQEELSCWGHMGPLCIVFWRICCHIQVNLLLPCLALAPLYCIMFWLIVGMIDCLSSSIYIDVSCVYWCLLILCDHVWHLFSLSIDPLFCCVLAVGSGWPLASDNPEMFLEWCLGSSIEWLGRRNDWPTDQHAGFRSGMFRHTCI